MAYEWMRKHESRIGRTEGTKEPQSARNTTSFGEWHREVMESITLTDLSSMEQEKFYASSLRAALTDGSLQPAELLSEVPRILPHFDRESLGAPRGEPVPERNTGERGVGFRQKFENGEVSFFLAGTLNDGTVRFRGSTIASQPPSLPEVEVFRPATWLRPGAERIVADRFEVAPREHQARRVSWKPVARKVAVTVEPQEKIEKPSAPRLRVVNWKPAQEVAAAKKKSPWNALRLSNPPIPQSQGGLAQHILRPTQKQIDLRLSADPSAEKGGVVTAPTGFGKTLIGVARMEEWLQTMKAGESILVVAPSPAVAEQWRHALCYQTWTAPSGEQVGVHLPSSRVFIGTPAELFRMARRNPGAPRPAVVILNAAGLERAARASENETVEPFLRALGTSRIVIDEIHQWVGNEGSPYHRVIEELKSLTAAGTVKSMIELTGTAFSVKDQLEALGLPFVANIESKDLIATGFVPPHSARAAISTLSPSEEVIHEGLLEMKSKLSNLIKTVDADQLRERFRAIYREDPEGLIRVLGDDLEKYVGTPEQRRKKILTRIAKLMTDEGLDLRQLDLVIGVQMHDQLSDTELFKRYARPDQKNLDQQLAALAADQPKLRAKVAEKIKVAEYQPLLSLPWGGRPEADLAQRRAELGKTLAGTYETLGRYRQHFGLGLAETILTIHREERRARTEVLSQSKSSSLKTMVFARPQNLKGTEAGSTVDLFPDSAPGLVLGATLQSKGRIHAVAVQTQQAIIPESDPALRKRIVDETVTQVLKGELSEAAVHELLAELPWASAASKAKHEPILQQHLTERVNRWIDRVLREGDVRAGAHNFNRFRESLRSDLPAQLEKPVLSALQTKLGTMSSAASVNARLALSGIVSDVIGWSAAVLRVREAQVVQGRTIGGDTGPIALVSFGKDASIMRSLFSRAFDSAAVGIDMAVFTEGSTTGMDIRRPSVAISADGVANRKSLTQRFGRVMRADPSFESWHSALMGKLIGTAGLKAEAFGKIDARLLERVLALAPDRAPENKVDERETSFLRDAIAAVDSGWKLELSGDLSRLSDGDRLRLATDVLLYANKVAHYYEVHEFRRGSVSPELALRKGALGRTEAGESKYETMTLIGPDGRVGMGADRAPIVNPSADTTPAKLGAILKETLPAQLRTDVLGWLEATAPGSTSSRLPMSGS